MKKPTLEQWNALPETSTALVSSSGVTRTVMKVDEETDGLESRYLAGPAAWAALHGSENLELVYVPGGTPSFDYQGPTLSLGTLQALLHAFNPSTLLRMRVDGFLCTPGRPFHAAGTGDEVSLGIAAMRSTVGDFLDQLAGYGHLNREPDSPLVLRADLPVRIRERLEPAEGSWAITGVNLEGGHAYLQLA